MNRMQIEQISADKNLDLIIDLRFNFNPEALGQQLVE